MHIEFNSFRNSVIMECCICNLLGMVLSENDNLKKLHCNTKEKKKKERSFTAFGNLALHNLAHIQTT